MPVWAAGYFPPALAYDGSDLSSDANAVEEHDPADHGENDGIKLTEGGDSREPVQIQSSKPGYEVVDVLCATWGQTLLLSRRKTESQKSSQKQHEDDAALEVHGIATNSRLSGQHAGWRFFGSDSTSVAIDPEGRLVPWHDCLQQAPATRGAESYVAWIDLAISWRGAVMAVNQKGIFLFDSVDDLLLQGADPSDVARVVELDKANGVFAGCDARDLRVVAGGGYFLVHLCNEQESVKRKQTVHQIWSYGDNRLRQLGRSTKGTEDNQLKEVEFFSPSNGFPSSIKKVVAGLRHSLVLTDDGFLYGWGCNDKGQLGIANETVVSQPRALDMDTFSPDDTDVEPIKDVACGHDHSIFIDQTGKVWGTGTNDHGQLASSTQRFETWTRLNASDGSESGASATCGPWTTYITRR